MPFQWVVSLARSVPLGAVIGMLGAALLATPIGFEIEEEVGLSSLFKLRGQRPSPAEVAVVAIDRASIDDCNLRRNSLCSRDKWPRSLHAELIDGLARANARVIAFDVRFDTQRDGDDALLGAAMARARRVAVAEFVKREEFPAGGAIASRVTIVPPIETVRNGALATAPFPLPKLPVRVSAYSPFEQSAGDVATLPIVAFQIAALPEYGRLLASCPALHGRLPQVPTDRDTFATLVRELRRIMTTEPDTAAAIRQCTNSLAASDASTQRVLESLFRVYAHEGPRYLDLYGRPHRVETIPYVKALQELSADSTFFSGKAVFVGVSEAGQPEQRDYYYTVFSRADGLDVSGVEIAATAYANLLENREVRWDYPLALAIAVLWGLAIGVVARALATPRAALAVIALAAAYVGVAHVEFAQHALWLPLVVPLLVQAPAAFAFGTLSQHRELSREKANIRKAFGHFLPGNVVDELARDVSHIAQHSQIVSGTCLATDIGGYTQIAETLGPGELRLVMNEYYDKVFNPVAEHHGIVSDVVGDAMVAIWAAATDDATLRERACRAALDISAAAEAFGRMPAHPVLPTRIGLETGQMALGNVGGMGHYEYRAVGDIVNTASRIQGLNKVLGTHVLASAAAFEGVRGLLGRHLGEFRLTGKLRPVSIFELVAAEPNVTEDQRWLCSRFGIASDALRAQRWKDAEGALLDVLERFPDDGPSRFYLQFLKREKGKAERWDGVVAVSS